MSLLLAREAMATTTKTKLPVFHNSLGYGGSFSFEDLRRVALLTPSILFACTGINDVSKQGNETIIEATWSAVITCIDHVQDPRDKLLLKLTTSFLMFLPFENWGYDGISSLPQEIRGTNLYNPTLDKWQASMFIVTWRQSVEAGTPDGNGENFDDLLAIGLDYLLQDPADLNPDAHDEVTFP
jgi:hypothetical protein